MDATSAECSFYKVQLSPRQSWMVVRSRKTEERDSRLEKLKACARRSQGAPMETEAASAAVEPLRRLQYTTGGSSDQHRSSWRETRMRMTLSDTPARFKGVEGRPDSQLASVSSFISGEPLGRCISCQNFEFPFVIKMDIVIITSLSFLWRQQWGIPCTANI